MGERGNKKNNACQKPDKHRRFHLKKSDKKTRLSNAYICSNPGLLQEKT